MKCLSLVLLVLVISFTSNTALAADGASDESATKDMQIDAHHPDMHEDMDSSDSDEESSDEEDAGEEGEE